MTHAKDGLRGFYRGFGTTVMREVRVITPYSQDSYSYPHGLDPLHIDTVPIIRVDEATAVRRAR